MDIVNLENVVGTEKKVDVRESLRENWKRNRNLKMSVVGYNQTDGGNWSLQAVVKDEQENLHLKYITLYAEDDVKLDESVLSKLQNKLIVIKTAQRNEKKVNDKPTGEFSYRSLYTGADDIEILGDYPKASTDGKFYIFYTDETFYQVVNVNSREFKGKFNPKTKKQPTIKELQITYAGMNGTKFELNKTLLKIEGEDLAKFDEKAFKSKIEGKKIKFTDKQKIYGTKGGESLYFSHIEPIIEEVKTQSSPKTEQK